MNKQVRPPKIDDTQKKSVDELLRGFSSGISYRALEPRIAFDAAAVATAAATSESTNAQSADAGSKQAADAAPHAASDGDTHDGDTGGAQTHDAQRDQSSDAFADAIMASNAPQQDAPVTIVFIDKSVENIDQIISSTDPSWEIVMIDQDRSGLDQMASYLSGRTDVGSIHVVSHGEAGTLFLGNDALSNANLADYQAQLTAIGQALNDNGDILLYGCDIAAGSGGMDFVRAFSDRTGADVAASVNRTGGDEAGGDWVLEATSGSIEAKALENPLYAGILAKTNSGTWVANGATAANDWTNTTDGITTTVTFTNASGSTGTFIDIANNTLNTAAGGVTNGTFDNGAAGSASLAATFDANNANAVGTVTITFSTAVTNPVIHLDRIGGVSGTANSSIWTLTSGGTLTRLSGVNHFLVDSTAGTIQRQTGGSSNGSESNTSSANGTAAGSVRVNGTFTTITFNLRMTSNAGAGDAFEIAFAIDAPPTAVDDTFTTQHNTPATINVRANDTDPRGDTLTVTKVNGTAITAGGAGVAVTGGTVTLVSGNLVFTPAANYVGSPSFTYTIADANGGESTATLTGTVTNTAPVVDLDGSAAGTGFSTTFTENGAAVSIADTDAVMTDVDDANLESASVTLTNQQTGDRLLVNGSTAASGTIGTIAWTRTNTVVTFTGTATKAQYAAAMQLIQFENTTDTPATTARIINTIVNDGNANSNTAVTTIAINRAPDPTDDAFSGNEDTAISANVLTNDTDVGDGPGSPPLSIVTGPANGVLTSFNTTTGAFIYTPNANYNGTDTFTYRYTDVDGDSKVATVTLTINPVNDAPVNAVPASLGPVAEDGTLSITGVSVTDVDSGTLTTTLTIGNGALNVGTGGGVTITGNGSGTVTLAGTSAQINAALATLSYTPTADYNGTATFQISTTDGALTDVDSRTITVTPVVDIVNDVVVTNEDTVISFNVISGLNETSGADNFEGTPVVTAINGAAYTAGTPISITGGQITVQPNGVVTFNPTANYNGATSFTYTVTSGGVTETATVNITVNAVNDAPVGVNDAGTATEAGGVNNGTAGSNATGNVLTNDTDVDTPAANLTVSAIRLGGTEGSGTAGTVGTALVGTYGTLTLNANGSYTYVVNNNNAAVQALAVGQTLTESFNYTVSDGSLSDIAVLTITINGANDAPVATNDTGTIAEDTTLTVNAASGLLANDTDVDGNTLSVTQFTVAGVAGTFTAGATATIPSVGTLRINADGSYVFTPAANYNGAVPVATYTVSDGAGGTATATLSIAVTPVNDAPVATNDTGTIAEDTTLTVNAASGLLANDTDVDGNTLSVTQFTVAGVAGSFTAGTTATIPGVGALTINVNGSYTFVPAANYNGAVPVATYTVSDGAGGTATSTLSIAVTPVNDAPVATNDTGTIAEDTTLTVNAASGLLANDTDVDGNTLSVTQFTVAGVAGSFTAGNTATIPGVGALTINANGSYTFVPAANYNGAVPVATYTVSDGAGGTATSTLSIAVTPVNDAPVATNDTGTIAEDTTLTVNAASGLLANDTDVDGNTLSVTQFTVAGVAGTFTAGATATIPSVGTLRINADGSYVFTPAANYNGAVPVATYTVSDGAGGTATATLSIAVTPVNDAPVATNDTGTIAEDTTLTVNAASGLLANDTDVDGNTLSVTQFTVAGVAGSFTAGSTATIPGVGALTINANGSYTFVPAANYNGAVPVATYTVSDGAGGTATATLSIAVTPVNDAPVNTVPGPRTAAEDTATAIAGVSVADVDGGSLTTTVSVTNGTLTVTLGGGATITGNGTGTITLTGTAATINAALAGLSFTGAADYNGPATLTVQTTDGSLTDTDTVAITVTPVADITNDTISATEDTASTFNVLTGTNGATADNFEATPAVTSVTQPANGTVTFAANGSITYTPSANFNGTDTFTYTVTSGGVTETATVTVNVAAVNDAPVNTVPGAQSSAEDTNLIFSAANGNAITVVDVDSSVTTTLTVVNGTLTLGSIAGITVTGNGSGTVTVSGTPAAITTALNGLRFAPTADWNGSTTLNVSTSDGVAPAVASSVAITVTPVADIVANSVTTAEDTAATFNVLANDNFENPGATVTSVTQPANGTVTIGSGGNVTYTPASNYNGSDSFTYTVTSGGVTETTTVTITVTPVNDAPVADNETNSTLEDTTLTVPASAGVLVGDTDVDGDTLAVSQFTVAGVTGTFAAGSTATIPGVGTLRINADGSYVFTPAANYNGAVPVATYTVSDGNGGTDTGTLTLTVTPVNDAPIAVDDTGTATEDTTLTVNAASGLLSNDTDVDGNTLTITQFTVSGVAGTFTAGSTATIPSVGTLTINANGSYTFVPAVNYNGAVPVATYTVSDGNGGTDTGTLTIAVTPVNDAPVADDEVNSTPEDTTLTVPASAGVLVGDTDVDGDTLAVSQFTVAGVADTFTAGSTATISGVGMLRINADGSYVFTPAANYNGAVPVATYTVSDGNGGTDTGTLTLTVTPVNDAPIAVDDTGTATEDTTLTVPAATGLLANDTDVDGNTLTITQFTVSGVAGTFTAGSTATIPSVGTLTINANGSYTFVPAANYNGAVPVATYTVSDGNGGTDTGTLTIAVTPVNDAPVNTVPGPRTAAEDTATAITGVSVSDVDGGSLTTTLSVTNGRLNVTLGGGATITGNGTGTVTLSGTAAQVNAALAGLSFTGNADYNGPATLTVQTTDGALTDTDTVAITVTPVADITNDTVSGSEDSTISFNVLTGTNGATADNFEGTPSVTAFTQPANGTVTVAANGAVVYTPNTNFNGTDTFTYTVTSGGVTETATVTINVAPVNDAPTQVLPPAQNGTEDTNVVFSGANGNQIILGDVDSGAVLTTTVSVPAGQLTAIVTPGVTITGNGTGSVVLTGAPAAVTAALNGLTYRPVADATGTVVMSVSTSDGVAAPVNGSISIAIAPVADIQNDTASVNEDNSATISVLANDSFENAGRTVTSVTNGANGTVVINGNGTVTYTPNANFNGTDTFTYTVTSGGVTETATVTVTVNPVNDAATQTTPPSQTTAEDTALVFSATNGNAVTVADIDGDTLTTTVSVTNGRVNLGSVAGVAVSGNGTGTVTITGSAAAINAALNGMAYTPTADYNGAAAMTVSTSDGATTASNTVAITVSPVADIVADTVTTPEDQAVVFNVLTNDTFENAGRAVTSVTNGANGTVTIGSGGQVSYTPNANFNGTDTFTYTVTSGGVTETASVTVTVTPVNDAVVAAVPGGQTTSEDTTVVFSTANGNAITVTDIDGDTISMTVSATNGRLTLGGTAGVTVSGNGTGTVTLSGSPAAINAALNGLGFAPAADYNGSAVISVTASDGPTNSSRTIAVTITPVADIVADSISTDEDTPATFNALTNDTFENPGRTVTSVTQGSSGSVTFAANGTITYTPSLDFVGTDTFTYTVTSNGTTETTTVTVTIGGVNDVPTTTGLPDRSAQDAGVVSINVSGAFSDEDGDALTYSATGLPAGLTINPTTGVISGTIDKAASQTSPYSVTITANDGSLGGTVSTSFTWTISNPAPTANNDTATVAEDSAPTNIDVLANDTDPDGDTLSVTMATAANGTVSILPNGTISYRPNANFNGTDTISYQISDGNGGFSTATVTVTVTPVNDAPVADDETNSTPEDTTLTVPASAGVLVGDTDVDGNTLSVTQFTVAGVTGTFTAGSTATISGVGTLRINADGSYVFTPAANYNGSVPVATYTVSDGNGGTDTATLTLTVTPVNDAPVADDETNSTPEDTTLTVPASAGVLVGDTDVDGNTLSVTQFTVAGVTGTFTAGSTATISGVGTLRINADGSYVFTPAANYNGSVPVATYTVSDGAGGTDTGTLTLTVTPVNDAPVVSPIADRSNADGQTVSINVGSNFSDVDTGDTRVYTATGLPAGLSINPATGVISGTINRAASQGGTGGAYSVTVTATDAAGAAVSDTFVWTITNPAPTAVADARTTSEGATLSVTSASGVLSNDTDPDRDPLSVSAINGVPANVGQPVAGSAGGIFTINANGSYTFQPNGQFEDLGVGETRQTTVNYTVSDGNGGTSTATVTITVTGTNDAPTATAIPPASGVDGATFTLNPSASFSDVDGDTLTYSATGMPAGLTINPTTGVISGTIDRAASQGGAGGVYTVTITASDGNGGSTPATLTLTVTNPAPDAVNDSRSVTEDTVATGNVLTNDVDPDGDTLAVTGFTVAGITGTFNAGDTANIPGVGTLRINADGSYTFTPAPDYIGAVPQVTYAITDGNGGTDTATLDLGPVTSGNDAPDSTPLPGRSSADASTVSINVSGNFSDGDGDALTFSATGLPPGLSINPATGVISGTIDHLASANGPYSVTVRATDPSGAATQQTFSWAVSNPAPTGTAIGNATGVDGTSVNLSAGAGFSDPDGDTLTFSASGLPTGLSINPATGVISGTLGRSASVGGPSSNGVYTIAVTATDSQGALVTRTFTYTVSNPAPIAGNDAFTGAEDTPLTGSVTANGSDPDGDALSYSVVSGPANGTLAFNANGTFTYTPAANYNGHDTFTYRVTDANGASATAVVTLTVTPVNDAPVASNVSVTTPEDQTFNGTLTATDVDSPSLTFTKATNPSHGTVVVNPNGTYVYAPAANYNGPDSFTYTVSDGAGGTVTRTVAINVTPVNDAPVAVNDAFSGNEDTIITGDVTPGTAGQDSDIEGDTITVVDGDGNASNGLSPVSGPANGTLVLNADGTFSYRPNANFNGTDSFRYRISDGNGGFAEATVLLTVNPVNDAPTAANGSATTPEDTTYNGTLPPASDVDGDTVTYSKASDPAHGTVVVNPNGTYVYTPAANYNGTDTFSYSINDGKGGVATYTVTVVVTPVDDAPAVLTITPPPSKDADVITFDVSKFVTDVDGDPLRYTATGLPPGLTINPATGVVTGTLPKDASQGGPYNVTLTVDDGNGGVVTTTFAWPVENPAPIAVDDRATVDSGKDVTVNVLANDRDPDGDALTVTRAQATNGTVDVLPDGSIRYVPRDGFVGQDRITYVISDGNGGTAIASVTITVRDDGYHEIPPQFGFNGPGEPDPFEAEPVLKPIPPSISADGAVVDAVFDIGLLRSVAGQLGANGAVLAAANGLRSLDGVASFTDNGIVVETVRVERAREILLNAGFDRSFQEYRIEGLPGFSLRNNIPGNLGGLSTREQIIIESLVRQDTLIIQLSNTIESGAKRIVDYRITQVDGSPLPAWLDHAAKDLLIGRRDAGFEKLDLKVEAIYSDQTVIVEHVRIDAATGEIQPLKMADAGQPAPRLFGDQFHAPSQLTPDEIQGLGKAIGR